MPKKILVVEDDPDERELLQTLLKLSGFEVVVAADGQEGFERAKTEAPDLVITDISMPRLNGLDLIRQLRALQEFKKVPILAVTSHGNEKAVEAFKAGASRSLSRPIENERLIYFVDDLFMNKNNVFR
jgi:CheY-like chemotaxis protein